LKNKDGDGGPVYCAARRSSVFAFRFLPQPLLNASNPHPLASKIFAQQGVFAVRERDNFCSVARRGCALALRFSK